MNILSFILWLPVFGALIVALLPRGQDVLARRIALVHASAAMFLSWSLLVQFDGTLATLQFAERLPWSPRTGLSYALGVDGLSLCMVLLTTLLSWVAMLASYRITERVRGYYSWSLVLEFGMLGVFMAQDWTFFFMFWEVTLVPLFFLIGQWGGAKRHAASLNFVLYTMGGSIFILVALIVIYRLTPGHSFAMTEMLSAGQQIGRTEQALLFAALLVGFGVKIPLFPLHGWLPLAHVEAPSPISILLSGVLLKMGAYGLLRITEMLPEGALVLQPWLVGLALMSILYGGLLAWRQSDLKAMIAYSSISHMGVVVLGISTLNEEGFLGAVLQMVAHGLIAAALFLLVGLLYERTHTREVADYGALVRVMPKFTVFMTLALLAAMGIPGSVGFVAELHTIVAGFERWGWWMVLMGVGVLVSAAYALRTIEYLFAGPVRPELSKVPDLLRGEMIAVAPLAIALVVLGVKPSLLLGMLDGTISTFGAVFAPLSN
jgi:NADH-quinone oxidoreductase subunit M